MSSKSLSRSVWSAPISLGWFMNAAATSTEGNDWPHQRCTSWMSLTSKQISSPILAASQQTSNSQPTTSAMSADWLSAKYFQPCPCTANQASIDFGRFQPVTGCSVSSSETSGACWTNQQATACYQSVYTTYVTFINNYAFKFIERFPDSRFYVMC